MEKRTVRLTKFEQIEGALNQLSKEYGDAVLNDDKDALKEISEKYKKLRILMLSNEDYFINYNPKDLKIQIQDEKDLERKYQLQEQLRLKKMQKREYKANKAYIGTIDKSLSIAEYAKRNKNKTWNFVRKHFKKFIAVGALAGILTVGLKSCSQENEMNKFDRSRDINRTTTEATTTTEEPTMDNAEVKVAEETTENKETNTDDLVVIPVTPYINGYKPKFSGSGFQGTGEVIESLIPNVSNSSTGEVITTTNIVSTTSVKEADPQEYILTETNTESLIPAQEKVTIVEKEEKIDTNVNNIPVEEGKAVEYKENQEVIKEETKIENGEKVTIVEKEEKTDTNVNNIPIDGEENKQEVKQEATPTIKEPEAIPSKEKVTIIEKEELTDINVNNIPIDENKVMEEKQEEKEEKIQTNINNLPIEEEKQSEVKQEVKQETKSEEVIPVQEKVTIIEKEEKINVNTNDIPIDDGKATQEKQETKSKVEIPTEERISEIEKEEFENSIDLYSLPIDEEVDQINEQTSSEGYTLTLKI